MKQINNKNYRIKKYDLQASSQVQSIVVADHFKRLDKIEIYLKDLPVMTYKELESDFCKNNKDDRILCKHDS